MSARGRVRKIEKLMAVSAGRTDDCDFDGSILWGEGTMIGPNSLAWNDDAEQPWMVNDKNESREP
jgi:hypothetical protein